MQDINDEAIAARGLSYRKLYVWSLVLYAAGVEHVLTRDSENYWVLLVPGDEEFKARQEIASFEKENLHWPPPRERSPGFDLRRNPPTILLMGLLVIFYAVTGPWTSDNVWFSRGAVVTKKIIQGGEWWRLITALTLHADTVHLLGNVLIGGMMLHFLCRMMGTGMGLSLSLVAGTLGNYMNIALRPGNHSSVGFSTAVFGIVGILCGLEMGRKAAMKNIILPLGAGGGLLALLGTEGERTDLGAHLWGFGIGIIIGVGAGLLPVVKKISEHPSATVLAYMSLALVVGCWWLAMGG